MSALEHAIRHRLPHLVVEADGDDLFGESNLAVFSRCGRYRYLLTRRWDAAKRWCAFVMLNPSTANAAQDDPTIRRCIGFAETWGAGGLLVLNLFGWRSPDPHSLGRVEDPVGPDNDAVIALALDTVDARPVVAAWGTCGKPEARAAAVLARLLEGGVELACLGATASGAPRHPLYVIGTQRRRPWRGYEAEVEAAGGRR